MPKILVVDDSPVDLRLAGSLLEKRAAEHGVGDGSELITICVANGREALGLLSQQRPDVIVTDMVMPDMTGLQIVEEVRRWFPMIPVILMTAHGSEDLAIQALRQGAASYVPKRNLARDLGDTVDSVLSLMKAQRDQQRLRDCLVQSESHFVLENDPGLIPPLLGHLSKNLLDLRICDEKALIRVSIALREALTNAMYHGNLEVTSDLRGHDDKGYHSLIEQRRTQAPYQDRRVHVTAREYLTEACYIVRDEGPGFIPSQIPDPTDPSNLEKASGRGLLLIRTFMDQVVHNDMGNQITLIKKREAAV